MSRLDAALDILSGLVLEDGRRWGEVAEPFQWADARAVLDPENETPYHFLTRSRGGSKTADLAGVAIAAMLTQLPAGARLYGLAADRDQGRLLVDSIPGYAARTPELRNALSVAGVPGRRDQDGHGAGDHRGRRARSLGAAAELPGRGRACAVGNDRRAAPSVGGRLVRRREDRGRPDGRP